MTTPKHPRFEIKTTKNSKAAGDQYYFVLTAQNGQVIAQSEVYNSKDACENGIESVRMNSPRAQVVFKDVVIGDGLEAMAGNEKPMALPLHVQLQDQIHHLSQHCSDMKQDLNDAMKIISDMKKDGMNKREKMAMRIAASLVGSQGNDAEGIAKISYAMADALIMEGRKSD